GCGMRLIGALLLCCLYAQALWPAQQASQPADFDIAPQPLSTALLQFSAQSGIQILAADTRLADRHVRPVRGRMLPAAALRRLLAGTGFSFRQLDAGTMVLLRASESGAPRQ